MEFRPFGTTGIEVSEVGFGAWAIGGDAWGPVEDADSLAAIERALELGVNFLDTADVYGDGRSESLVGRVLNGRRERVVVSTKGGLVGHHRDPQREPVYDRPEKVLVAFDASLRRLETDYIDVYWCHIWWHDARETAAFLDAFATLKRDGKVRAVGVSTDSMEHLRQFHQGTGGGGAGIDAVQLDYSILNRKSPRATSATVGPRRSPTLRTSDGWSDSGYSSVTTVPSVRWRCGSPCPIPAWRLRYRAPKTRHRSRRIPPRRCGRSSLKRNVTSSTRSREDGRPMPAGVDRLGEVLARVGLRAVRA